MLNLSRSEDLLTQGQPPADRVLANPDQGRPNEGQADAAQPAGLANSSVLPGVDPQAIARRVYELMKQDLSIDHERAGHWR
jgi:hypothetical protein